MTARCASPADREERCCYQSDKVVNLRSFRTSLVRFFRGGLQNRYDYRTSSAAANAPGSLSR
jgi:hypothetical protein